MGNSLPLRVEVPAEGYHRSLISCQVACPVHTDARGYIQAVAAGRFGEAYLIARGPNPFASICGHICGAPCEAACRRGQVPRVDADGSFVAHDRPVAIRALKRLVCELYGPEARGPEEVLEAVGAGEPGVCSEAEEMAALLRGARHGSLVLAGGTPVAIIGAGPAGLAAAHDLALLGCRPTVFEMEPTAAGMLSYGVPAYRLPRQTIEREIAVIEALGVQIRCGVTVGRDVTLADLRRDHAAVIIAVGAKGSRRLGLPGERGPGVLGGVDLLRSVSLGEPVALGDEVVVIGGGNVAYDVARTVVRQESYDVARSALRVRGTRRVHLVSLETLEEMPADTVEIREGDEEGIDRLNGWGPVEIQRDGEGRVAGVRFRRCLRVYDEQRRFSPVYDEGDTRVVPASTVLLAVGQAPDLSFLEAGGADVEQFRPGWPKVDPQTLMTTAPGVFVTGDLAHGTRLLIDAIASGKAAARSVYTYATGRRLERQIVDHHVLLERYRRAPGYEAVARAAVPTVEPGLRLLQPDTVVELGYDAPLAQQEASRCLDCGVTPVFDGARCVLCGGCADVCPTQCLKLVSLADLVRTPTLDEALAASLGEGADLEANSAILKDEERCIRCGLCAMRCPVEAIGMERVSFTAGWSAALHLTRPPTELQP
ncbi:MAG: FAD-dependent oxidoreductase [Candidatus Latescibacterota bacterium]